MRADWSTVKVGDTVVGRGRNLWVVQRRHRGGKVTLERDGKTVTVDVSGTVEVAARAADVEPPGDAMEHAVATAQVVLGGTTEATRDPGETWVCRPWSDYRTQAEMRSHLYLFHGTYTTDVKGRGKNLLAQLTEIHDTHHGDAEAGRPLPNGWQDHTHGAKR